MQKPSTYNIADLFESLADAIPDRDALVAGATRHTFASLDARANQIAHFLISRGVKPGQHVGLHLYNSAEFIEILLGCLKARAVPINVNYRFVSDELRHMIVDGDLVAVFSSRGLFPVLEPAARGVDFLKTLVVVDDGDGPEAPAGVFDYEKAIASMSKTRGFEARSNDDLYIVYTGGTTGMPKGVMWRHEDLFFAGLQGGRPGGEPIESPEELAAGCVEMGVGMNMLPAAPLIHGAAQFTCWIAMFTGGKLVLQAGKSFDAGRIWELVRDEEIHSLVIVGDAMAIPLLEELEKGDAPDVSGLMTIASAGAVLSPAIKEKLQAKLESTMVLNNFGATEVGHQGASMGDDPSADGRPSFYMDETSAVLDEDGKPIEPGSGKLGRLARRGRIPLGYYKDEVKTAERFVTIEGQRWVVPGDMATVEEDGRITVYGRGSNCINTGGEKVFPEEVEEALKSHPDVRDALVVGIPDPRWMQRVAAVVEPVAGKSLTLDELVAHCRKHVAGYKVPRQLTVVDRVSRFPTGKPDYTWAKEQALATAAKGA